MRWILASTFVIQEFELLEFCAIREVSFRVEIEMMTIKNKYLLSRIDDLFDQLYLALVFSKINMLTGYHQLKTNET